MQEKNVKERTYATNFVADKMPLILDHLNVEGKSKDEEVVKTTTSLNKEEETLLNLCRFFENPKTSTFSLNNLYAQLEGSWLRLALQAVQIFFEKDTYLLPEDNLVSQTGFAQILSENGKPFDRRKLSVYYKRGVLPNADLEIEGVPYWRESTIDQYIKKQVLN